MLWGMLLGLVMIGFTGNLMLLVGIRLTITFWLGLMLFFTFLVCVIRFWRLGENLYSICLSIRWKRTTALIGIMGVLVASLASTSVDFGFRQLDEYAVWGLKAKLLYYQGELGEHFTDPGRYQDPPYPRVDPNATMPLLHPLTLNYPLHFPLLGVWVCHFAGSFNERLIKLIPTLLWLLFVLVIAQGLGGLNPELKWVNLVISLIFCSSPLILSQAVVAQVDLCLGLYLAATARWLLRWLKRKDRAALVLASLFCAQSAMIKNEGLVLSIGFAIAVLVVRSPTRKAIRLLPIILSFFFIVLPWQVFCLVHGLGAVQAHYLELSLPGMLHILSNLDHLFIFWSSFINDIALDGCWLYLWTVLTILFLLAPRNFTRSNKNRLLTTPILLYLAVLSLLSMSAPGAETLKVVIIQSFERIFVPLYGLLVMLIFSSLGDNFRRLLGSAPNPSHDC